MPRHKVRSHLSFDPIPSTTACGIASPLVMSLTDFLEAENRCQRCDRIAHGLKANTGGGRNKKDTLKYPIVLSGLTDAAASGLEALAAAGLAGETIGLLVNRYFEKIQGE